LIAAVLLAACSKTDSGAAYAPTLGAPASSVIVPEYKLGVVPMENFRNIYEVFLPIVEHVNARLPDARLTLEVPRGLPEFEQALAARAYAITLASPYHAHRAASGDAYRVFGKMGDDDAFRGILIVKRGSAIQTLADLKGRQVSFPPKTALAATMMTQVYLKEQGIDPARDIAASYVGGQHASIMQVYQGHAAAGASWPLGWVSFQRLHPHEAQQLEVRFATASLIHMALMARTDMAPELVERIAALFASLDDSAEGRAMLERVPVTRFERATNASYARVGVFLDRHRRLFGPESD